MAIGLALVLGIRLPQNFESPYRASSIVDFWRRWHITLSRFLRDYVYIPIGGNRNGVARRHLNLLFTMLVGGMWHGAGWTFVFWGGLHGFYLIVNHLWSSWCRSATLFTCIPRICRVAASWGLTFLCVVVGWVFFRATSFSAALGIVKGMAGLEGLVFPSIWASKIGPLRGLVEGLGVTFGDSGTMNNYEAPIIIGVPMLVAIAVPNVYRVVNSTLVNLHVSASHVSEEIPVPLKSFRVVGLVVGAAILGGWALLHLNRVSEFLYFQF